MRAVNGCRHAEFCDFCHEHGYKPDEVDWSTIISDPKPGHPGWTRRLDKHERAWRNWLRGPDTQERREYWAGLIQAALQDRRFCVRRPLAVGAKCLLYFAVWTVHKLLDEASCDPRGGGGERRGLTAK